MNTEIVLLRISLEDPVKHRCSFKSKLNEFTFQQNEPILIPYQDQYEINFYKPKKFYALIAFKELLQYASFKHNLNIETCNSSYRHNRNKQLHKLKVQFCKINLNRRYLFLEIQFLTGSILTNTEPLGKMSPYLRVTNKTKNFVWTSKEDKNGHKQPKFNQNIQIPFYSVLDQIQIQVIDKDMFKDDLIGTLTFKPISVIENYDSVIQKPFYQEGEKVGFLNFQLLQGPKLI